MREFHIDPRVEEEIVNPTPYPLVVPFPEYVYMILHYPSVVASGEAKRQEIDFIVGRNMIITVRYEVVECIHNLHKVFEAEDLLGLPAAETNTSELLERMMRRLYSAIRHDAERLAEHMDRIERDIFSGKERETVKKLSDLNRVLLRFDTTLRRHADALHAFLSELQETRFLGKGFAAHAAHIHAELKHVTSLVSSFREVAVELRTTNDSLLSLSQNQVMKMLTLMSLMTFPLTLIAAIFAMQTDYLPIVGTPGDFWIIIGIMMTIVISLLTVFRLNRWL